MKLLAAIICLAPALAFAQPAESLPPTQGSQANVDKANADGSTGSRKLTAADYQAFIDLWASGSAWEDWNENVTRRRPGNAINPQATVTGTSVALTWTAPAPAMVTGAMTQYVTRDGALVAQLSGTANNHTDSSVPNGSHQWTISTRNVTTGSYAGTFAPVAAAPSVSATVGTGPPPSSGWTDLSLPAGALSFYVSASGGSDSNAGTQAAPLKTIAAGYARLRDGQPDQLLLRCGDTWNQGGTLALTKGGGGGKYQVIGSYGTGPAPRVNFTGSGINIGTGKAFVAILGLDIRCTAANTPSGSYGIMGLRVSNILIEGNHIGGSPNGTQGADGLGFSDNIVIEKDPGQTGTRLSNITVRRNTIEGSRDPGDNRSMGLYTDSCDGLLIEQNFFLDNGVRQSQQSRHLYIQDDTRDARVLGNVFWLSPAEGFQLRPGGRAENNIILDCPIGAWISTSTGTQNVVSFNTVFGSGPLEPTIPQLGRWGVGLDINGPTTCQGNIIAYCSGLGWGNVQGLWPDGATGSFTDNYIREWTLSAAPGGGAGDQREGRSISVSGGNVNISNNRVFMARNGIVMEANGTVTGSGNTYWAPPGGLGDFRPNSTFPGWTKTASLPPDPNLKSLLPGGSISAYVALCRGQSKANWRTDLMPQNVNPILRAAVGIAEPINP